MEKPLCRTIDEADQILHACHMTHAKLALAHTTRYSPVLARVRELINDGTIGKVLEFRGRGKEDARGGGEDLWVLGSHIMNLFTTLGGPPEWCFAKVSQNGRPITKSEVKPGNEGIGPLAGDDVRATYGLANGATATFQSTRNVAGNPSRFALQIYGTKGIIEIGTGYLPPAKLLVDSSWSPGRSGIGWKNISSAGVEQPEPLAKASANAGNVAAMNDLIDAIEQNREPLCSAEEARTTIAMILAVFESQRTGAPVSFPLSIKGNPLAGIS
jgi:predicted dehydrogenase